MIALGAPDARAGIVADEFQFHWRGAITALMLGVVAAIYIGKLPPAVPGALRAEFQLSFSQSGWLVSAFNTLGMLASHLHGLIAACRRAWNLCMTGLAFLIGGGTWARWPGQSNPASPVACLRKAWASLSIVVSAPGLIILSTAVADRRRVFSFWGGYMPTGTALGMVLAPVLIASFGWRGLVARHRGLRRARHAAPGRVSQRLRRPRRVRCLQCARRHGRPLRAPGPWWIALAFGCYAFNYYAIMVWLPTSWSAGVTRRCRPRPCSPPLMVG